jgi:hypothetical protein
VFFHATAFNQDVSTWNMDAVTTTYRMFLGAAAFADNTFFCAGSTNTGSWPTSVIRASDFFNSGVTDFSCGSNHLNNMIIKDVVDDWCGTDAAKKTAVQTAHGSIEDWDVSRITNMMSLFQSKGSFNADLSKWSTGAVTRMDKSKCTLFLSVATVPSVVVCCLSYIRQLDVDLVTILTRVLLFFCLWFETGPFVVVCFDRSFLCCTLLSSCSVCFRICVQFGRVQMEYGGGDKYAKQ